MLTSAISGIEQALWDIKGKALGVPVHDLLGGPVRDRIRMYTHIKTVGQMADYPVELMVESARQRMRDGFTALKYSIIPPVKAIENLRDMEKHVERFAAVREAIGPEIDLAIDFHGRVSPATAQRLMGMLEPYYPFFVEEPCLPENTAAMADLASRTPSPWLPENAFSPAGASGTSSKSRPCASSSPICAMWAASTKVVSWQPWPRCTT